MKLSNIFEQNPAQAAAMGANVLKKTMGSNTSGSIVSKALDKLDQGTTLSGPLAKALAPYADALEKILSNPVHRNKFMQMMKQIQAADKKEQPAQEPAPMVAPQESVTEDQESIDAVAGAVTRRIMSQHLDILSKYGPVKVMASIDDVAEFAGEDGLDEIGSSDVSIWTDQVIKNLEKGYFDHLESVQEEPVEEAEQIDEISAGLARSAADAAYDKAYAARKKNWPSLSNTEKKRNIQGRKFDRYANKKEIANEEGYYAPGPETMPGAVGPQEDTNVNFTQTKNFGDAYVTINANAKDMEELHRVLKLAGIEVEKSATPVADETPEERPEGEPCPQCGSVDCTCPPGECTCNSEEPADLSYSTDKQTLINVLRDKLQKRLK